MQGRQLAARVQPELVGQPPAQLAVAVQRLALAARPGNVFVAVLTGGLEEDSVVNVTQLVALDGQYLDDRIGALPRHLLADVDRGLRGILGR